MTSHDTLPKIQPVPGSRHAYQLRQVGDGVLIEELDLPTGAHRAYPISPEEVDLIGSVPERERDAVAWRLYHVARLRSRTGGTHGGSKQQS